MTAETIPADVLAIARESVANEAQKEGAPWSMVDRIRAGALDGRKVPTAVAAILADRSTRPAEPAPKVEVGEHPDAMRRPWELRGPTQIYGNLQRDQHSTGDRVAVTTSPADAALIVEAVNAYDTLRSTLEAERARADHNAERAEEAERLRVEHAMAVDELRRGQDEAVRVAVEDERDRLLMAATQNRITMSGGGSPAWVWIRGEGAMAPAERARLRADQPAGEGGEA